MNTQEEEYITLFCEGDGCVGLYPYPTINFGQKERDVLDYIDSLTENGHIYYDKSTGVWRLTFNGRYCLPLLEIFSRHVVGKSFLDRLNKVLEFVGMSLAVQHPITEDGLVGFWDAEGSSDNQPYVLIAQKDREILDLVVVAFSGSVSRDKDGCHRWHLGGKEARTLFKILLEKSHYPSRRERLRKNFEGPSYYELNKDDMKARSRVRYEVHKEERKVRSRKLWLGRKAIRDWMKLHPEEVAKLGDTML